MGNSGKRTSSSSNAATSPIRSSSRTAIPSPNMGNSNINSDDGNGNGYDSKLNINSTSSNDNGNNNNKNNSNGNSNNGDGNGMSSDVGMEDDYIDNNDNDGITSTYIPTSLRNKLFLAWQCCRGVAALRMAT
jgi:hypothetical protein